MIIILRYNSKKTMIRIKNYKILRQKLNKTHNNNFKILKNKIQKMRPLKHRILYTFKKKKTYKTFKGH